jgi:hypothetical protein
MINEGKKAEKYEILLFDTGRYQLHQATLVDVGQQAGSDSHART